MATFLLELSSRLRRSVSVFLIAAAILIAGCNGVFYYPSTQRFTDPSRLGIPVDEVTFTSQDGTKLSGWFFRGAPRNEAPAPATVVHFHGNAENLSSHFRYAVWLVPEGFNLFVWDYRGYGRSEGRVSRGGIREDARAAMRYVKQRPDVDPDQIIVFGQSLGGAIAVTAAADEREGVRAVVIESAFSSYRQIAREKLAGFWLSWPLQWPLSFLVSDRFSPVDVINAISPIPVLVIHETVDPIVPFHHSERLYAAAAEPKALWAVAGSGHTATFTKYGVVYRPALLSYLRSRLDSAPDTPDP